MKLKIGIWYRMPETDCQLSYDLKLLDIGVDVVQVVDVYRNIRVLNRAVFEEDMIPLEAYEEPSINLEKS